MGLSKVVKVSDREVRFVHQLDGEGKAYAEDVIIKLQDGVDASRMSFWASMDGKVGVPTVSFSEYPASESLKFPEQEDKDAV